MNIRRRSGWLLILLATGAAAAQDNGEYRVRRERMARVIEAEAETTGGATGRAAFDERVMAALRKVPRHEFVPDDEKRHAYENRPLPIGYGQTISQPYIVALMTDLLDPQRGDVVLELGTGSGYQAAVLAELVKEVYTIEIVEPLGRAAKARLERLGVRNVTTRVADGYHGWPEHAPFDGIVVTAAADHIPPPLVRQLKPGGRMVIPVGGPFLVQQLTLVEKDAKGGVTTRQLLPVRFVPLTRKR
jgi:protein-L-isoaspartate(D-aspartate) O-methyltransferase